MLLVIFACVFKLKTLRKIEIQLYRSKLPDAAYCILDLNVDLRSVECSLAFDTSIRDSASIKRCGKLCFGRRPIFISAQIALIFSGSANGQLELYLIKSINI